MNVKTGLLRTAAAASLTAAMVLPGSLAAFAAPAAALQSGSSATREVMPLNNDDTAFIFDLTSQKPNRGAGIRRKDNSTSVYVKVERKKGDKIRFFVDGYPTPKRVGKRDCTQGTYRTPSKLGAYEMYNTVNENGLGYAELTAYREKGDGGASGLWSPDCVGHFPKMPS